MVTMVYFHHYLERLDGVLGDDFFLSSGKPFLSFVGPMYMGIAQMALASPPIRRANVISDDFQQNIMMISQYAPQQTSSVSVFELIFFTIPLN